MKRTIPAIQSITINDKFISTQAITILNCSAIKAGIDKNVNFSVIAVCARSDPMMD